MDFSDKLIYEYRNQGNKTLSNVCRYIALLMFIIGCLNFVGVFIIKSKWMYMVIGFSILIALLPTLIFDILKKETVWAQYLVLTSITIMVQVMYAVLSYHAIIMLVFPLVCACLYNEKRWIVYTVGISIPLLAASHLTAYYLHVVPDEPLVTLRGVILYGILPREILLIAFGIICSSITEKLQRLISTLVGKNNELYEDQQTLIQSLSEIIEAQSQETGHHVKRVSEYTRVLCEGLNCDDEDTWMVSIAAMMHDVGKLIVPSEIIDKPGKLTDKEFDIIKKHVDYGRKMLENSHGVIMQLSAVIAYQHHEKWDGTGYKHLKGDEINLYARCVAIADVFDALVSVRPYKKAWTSKEAYDEIVAQSGRQFDPKLVDIFKDRFDKFEEILKKYPA